MKRASSLRLLLFALPAWIFPAGTAVAQNYPSKPIRLIVPYPPGDVPALGEGVGVGAETPGLWHWAQRWLAIAMVLLASLWIVPVVAQNYPSKPIRLIVPYPPGGANDNLARPLTQKLGENMGTQVILDNRGGGGAMIGAELVAKAQPDGYTLLFCSTATHATSPQLFKRVPYDPFRDFEPITLLVTSPVLAAVNNNLPIASIKDLVAAARGEYDKYGKVIKATGARAE